jgi:hypothetical protein
MYRFIKETILFFLLIFLISCKKESEGQFDTPYTNQIETNEEVSENTPETSTNNNTSNTDNCQVYEMYTNRPDCEVTLTLNNEVSIEIVNNKRVITSNNIPDHKVGVFGQTMGSLNPNSIQAQSSTYTISSNPQIANNFTPLSNDTGNQYSFGILMNGVELDPVPAEPWPHEGMLSPDVNWDWNLEAPNVNIGMDCNVAHVQPNGKYHYHGMSPSYLESINIQEDAMTLVGYAGDGFPIYYKYAYSDPDDSSSEVVELEPSYQLKSGERPGDGVTAPCGEYTGIYGNDFEYIADLSGLDEANGRSGITPEYPDGTYYYVITDGYPWIPRYFRGEPSNDFRIGGGPPSN